MPCSEDAAAPLAAPTGRRALLLLLGDGRFPGGGHAHSGGLEAAVAGGSVRDLATLSAFCRGRLHTQGVVDGWFAAAACRGESPVALGDECEARLPSPRQRLAGASLGRGLRRAAARLWPAVAACPATQHPVVLGVVADAAGLSPVDAAALALHGQLLGLLAAAPKLFALDTTDALRVAVELASEADALAASAARSPQCPTVSAPLLDLLAEEHARLEVQLFAS
jgi:urease accessory protein